MLTKEDKEKLRSRGHVKYKGEIFPVDDIRDLSVDPGGNKERYVVFDTTEAVPLDHDDLTLPTVEEVTAFKQEKLNQR